ncbi:MAG: hypothetical protein LBG94_04620 [Treponema sp.]|jgi:hypothetical protein|nr:hypothetical protein [Treponema sp.]
MSDEKTVSENRPNAKYNLSYPDTASEGLTFHYNRERRLANAPESVQDIYKEEKKSRFGLFGVLVADRPRRMLFFMIVLLCFLILILSRLEFFDTSHILEGNRIEITGTFYEDSTIVLVKKTVKNQNSYTGAVDIAVSVNTEADQIPVYYHRIFFTLENEEIYRFAVPYNSEELLMILQTEKNTLKLSFKPQ